MININENWQSFLKKDKLEQIKILSDLWQNSCFPQTGNYISENLKDINIDKNKYSIEYLIYNKSLKQTFKYLGYIPVEKQNIPFKNKTLEFFYNNISNGFVDSDLHNVGPEPIESITPFTEYDWEIGPKNLNTNNKFIIFNNGGSNYLVIDNNIKSETNGILWSSIEYNPKTVNPIKLLDNWILLGLSDY